MSFHVILFLISPPNATAWAEEWTEDRNHDDAPNSQTGHGERVLGFGLHSFDHDWRKEFRNSAGSKLWENSFWTLIGLLVLKDVASQIGRSFKARGKTSAACPLCLAEASHWRNLHMLPRQRPRLSRPYQPGLMRSKDQEWWPTINPLGPVMYRPCTMCQPRDVLEVYKAVSYPVVSLLPVAQSG